MIHTGPNSKIDYTEKVKAKVNRKQLFIVLSFVFPFCIYGLFHFDLVSSNTDSNIPPEISHSVAEIYVFDESNDLLGRGSGFLVSPNLLFTNRHVIDGASSYLVSFKEHPTLSNLEFDAKLIYTPDGKNFSSDYAVLSIDRNNDLVPLEFEQDVDSKNGDLIYAYGYPSIGGIESAFSLTKGIISNLDIDPALMLIDCDIYSGNSGGPTINENGKVIGINTSGMEGKWQGQNFSLKINHVLNDQAIQSFDWSGENVE